MMGRGERDKGGRGQREAMALIVGFGGVVHRGAQGGAHDADPDLRVEFGRWRLAVEVKRRERLDLPGWWRQAVGYAAAGGEDVMPVVMWRRSREEWLAAVRAGTLMELLRLAPRLEWAEYLLRRIREENPALSTYIARAAREFLGELGGE